MKIRTDFVTNSSSSSYLCAYCGPVEIYDSSDESVYECENDHMFCESHITDSDTWHKEVSMLDAKESDDHESFLMLSMNKICAINYFYEFDLQTNIPASMCPVCQGQIDNLSYYVEKEILFDYLIKIHGTNLNEIKNNFKKNFKKVGDLYKKG